MTSPYAAAFGEVTLATLPALLLLAVAWLVRRVIDRLLAGDLARHQAAIESRAHRELEELKSHLSKLAHEHQVRFDSMNDRRFNALEELHAGLVEFRIEVTAYVTRWSQEDREGFHEIERRASTLVTLLEKKGIYIPEATYESIMSAVLDMRRAAVAAATGAWPQAGPRTQPLAAGELEQVAFLKAQKAVASGGPIDSGARELRRHIRSLLEPRGSENDR